MNGGGTLTADASASPSTPIRFTTANPSPAPGQWMGVYFQGNSSGMLNTVIVQFAGTNRGAGQFGVRVDASGLPAWGHVTLANNQGTGLELELNASVVVPSSNFQNGPTAKGVTNNSTGSVDARNSYWNSASGPTIAGNPGGTGDAIVGTNAAGVLWNPFSTTPN